MEEDIPAYLKDMSNGLFLLHLLELLKKERNGSVEILNL